MTDKTLTAKALKLRLSYDPETGQFVRLSTLNARHRVGVAPGTAHSAGYRVIGLDGKNYKAHRLAWLYVYGEWPAGELDHINGIKTDNRISNLRIATRSENTSNRFRARADNRLGILGVSRVGNRYIARFRDRYLGIFRSPEEAQQAYINARSAT